MSPLRLLRDFLRIEGIKPTALARAAGVDQGQFSRILSGRRSAGLSVATRIEGVTKIPASLWVGYRPRNRNRST